MTVDPADEAVSVLDLTKRYPARRGSGPVTAVDHLSLSVRRGEVYGFLGPNGAGKTTTLRMLLGLVAPTSGSAAVLGLPPGERSALSRTGSLIEGPAFYPYLSGRDNLRLMARYAGHDPSRVEPALERVGLSSRSGDRYSTYSMGMKQRLGVASALMKDPALLVLDEPTNGLDPAGIRDMRTLVTELRDEGRTVVLSSHMMNEVQQVCDRVCVIHQGRLVTQSTVGELRRGADLVITATPSDTALATLHDLPAVRRAQLVDGRLRVDVDDIDTGLVNQALVRAGVLVTELRREEQQLEDVFLELTDSHQEKEKENVHA